MDNHTYTMPLIGDKAPSFEAETTQGKIRFPEDFKGQWVILFSHPSDFTPICTSEFVMFGAMQAEFEALNCRLVGLSVGTKATSPGCVPSTSASSSRGTSASSSISRSSPTCRWRWPANTA